MALSPSLASGKPTGSVRFTGELEVRGVVQDLPDADPPSLCLLVDGAGDALPRPRHEPPVAWFCFEDAPGLRRRLPTPGRDARVVVDGYRAVFVPTGLHDTARLVRVR